MQTVKQYCVCGRGFVTLFWNSKCISFRQLKRWVYWGLSLNSSKYTYCVCVCASFSTTATCPIMHSGMSLFSMPSCSWVTHDATPSVHSSRFMHLSHSVHTHILVSTWNTIFEHWRMTSILCGWCVSWWWCVSVWLCDNKGKWQSSSVYWIWKFHQLSSQTHENLKQTSTQPDLEGN